MNSRPLLRMISNTTLLPAKLRLGVPSALTLTLTNPLPIGSTDKTSAFIPEPSMQLSKRVFLASDLSSMHHTVSFDGRRNFTFLTFFRNATGCDCFGRAASNSCLLIG